MGSRIISDEGNGRWSFFASSQGAVIQISRSSSLVRMTGMALGWMAATTALGSEVRKPNNSCRPGLGVLSDPRTPSQLVQIPAKKASGLSWLMANHRLDLRGFVSSHSQNVVHGTRQRCSGPSHRRQWEEAIFRILVTPESGLPLVTKLGDGIPQIAKASSLPVGVFLITGAGRSG